MHLRLKMVLWRKIYVNTASYDKESSWNRIVTPRIGLDHEVTKYSHPKLISCSIFFLLKNNNLNLYRNLHKDMYFIYFYKM